jgi:hypothetical protein
MPLHPQICRPGNIQNTPASCAGQLESLWLNSPQSGGSGFVVARKSMLRQASRLSIKMTGKMPVPLAIPQSREITSPVFQRCRNDRSGTPELDWTKGPGDYLI